MTSKSFQKSFRFKNQMKRFIFVTEQIDTADEQWDQVETELVILAESVEDPDVFWQGLAEVATKHGFYQVKE